MEGAAPTLAAAFLMGLLGNVHCLAMCGGVVSAFSMASPAGRGAAQSFAQALPYNLGRIGSYAVAGAVAGSAGLVALELLGETGALALRFLFGGMLVAAGLYVAGYTRSVAWLERLARPLWRRASRALAPLLPADRMWKALVLGGLWGWLPCGLVYAALLGAVASGSAQQGALLMLGFGAGTLPGLVVTGGLAGGVRDLVQRSRVRAAAGVMVALFGVWTLAGAAAATLHAGHGAPGEPHGETHAHGPPPAHAS